MKKDIRKIAEKAGFEVKIFRHGCYTVYILTKRTEKIRIVRTSDKGKSTFEIMANFLLKNNTQYITDTINFDGYKYALSDGNNSYAQLTMDEITAVIEAN